MPRNVREESRPEHTKLRQESLAARELTGVRCVISGCLETKETRGQSGDDLFDFQ